MRLNMLWISLCLLVLILASCSEGYQQEYQFEYDFETDEQGWVTGFADLPVDYDPVIYEALPGAGVCLMLASALHSIAVGNLAGAVVGVVAAWSMVSWRPSWYYSGAAIRSISRFSVSNRDRGCPEGTTILSNSVSSSVSSSAVGCTSYR